MHLLQMGTAEISQDTKRVSENRDTFSASKSLSISSH